MITNSRYIELSKQLLTFFKSLDSGKLTVEYTTDDEKISTLDEFFLGTANGKLYVVNNETEQEYLNFIRNYKTGFYRFAYRGRMGGNITTRIDSIEDIESFITDVVPTFSDQMVRDKFNFAYKQAKY